MSWKNMEKIKKGNLYGMKLGDNEVWYPENSMGEKFYDNYYDDVRFAILKIRNNECKSIVMAHSDQCELLWEKTNEEGNELGVTKPFKYLYKDDEGKLWLMNMGGRHFELDPYTGEVKGEKYEEIDYDWEGSTLRRGEKKMEFEDIIEWVFPYDEKLIVETSRMKPKMKSNLYVYSTDGKKLWEHEDEEIFNMPYIRNDNKDPEDLSFYDGKYAEHFFNIRTGEKLREIFTKI